MRRIHVVAAVTLAALIAPACGGDDTSSPDAGRSGDPCAIADTEMPSTAVGCNGPPPGPAAPANGYGGLCAPSDTELAGSCIDEGAQCWSAFPDADGICVLPCAPRPTYVSTSDCPSGSRCFTFGAAGAWCFPDCTSDADCSSASCDTDGSCVGAAPTRDGGTESGDAATVP